MSVTPAFPAVVIPAGEGRALHAFGDELIFHLDGQNTNGNLCLWTDITPPGGGPPPHYHLHEDEWFVVQEGRVSFLLDGAWREMAPGSVVYLPRLLVHAFRNVGDEPCRNLVATSPAGMENFFARCAEEFQKPGGPDMEQIVQIGVEHGICFVSN